MIGEIGTGFGAGDRDYQMGYDDGLQEGERRGWEKGIKAAAKLIRQASFPIGPAYADKILKLKKP